jgi:PhnB protein
VRVEPHIVAPDAGAAADWYARAFGAVASEFPDAGILSPLSLGGTATVLHIATDDAEALWARALAAGAEVRHELADQFWGERQGQLTDPFGHRWNVAQRVRDVPHDEVVSAAATAFGGG